MTAPTSWGIFGALSLDPSSAFYGDTYLMLVAYPGPQVLLIDPEADPPQQVVSRLDLPASLSPMSVVSKAHTFTGPFGETEAWTGLYISTGCSVHYLVYAYWDPTHWGAELLVGNSSDECGDNSAGHPSDDDENTDPSRGPAKGTNVLLDTAADITVGPGGDLLFISDSQNRRVLAYNHSEHDVAVGYFTVPPKFVVTVAGSSVAPWASGSPGDRATSLGLCGPGPLTMLDQALAIGDNCIEGPDVGAMRAEILLAEVTLTPGLGLNQWTGRIGRDYRDLTWQGHFPTGSTIGSLQLGPIHGVSFDAARQRLLVTNYLADETTNAVYSISLLACEGAQLGDGCDDGNPCTKSDACMTGPGGRLQCQGMAYSCPSAGQCFASSGSCDGLGGCVGPPVPSPAGVPCVDNNPCTHGERCDGAGGCGGGTLYACPQQQCDSSTCAGDGTCVPADAGTSCDDGDACSSGDHCDESGSCRGYLYTCPWISDCQWPSCDGSGGCSYQNASDGTPCDDGDACTRTDRCVSGLCVGSDPVVCSGPPTDQCHDAVKCDSATGQCSSPPKPDGTPCDDGVACTQSDGCHGGRCFGGNPSGCPDPWAGYVPDPEVYMSDPDPANVVTVDGSTFPVDELLVSVTPGTSRIALESLAAPLGGTVVGQIPDFRLYKLKFPISTPGELDAMRDALVVDPRVAIAGKNLATTSKAQCPPESDNRNLTGPDRCTYTGNDFYQALTVFEELRPDLRLYLVRAAVIDSGLSKELEQFDDTPILNLGNPGVVLRDTHPVGHGTRVAAIMAGDDRDTDTTGIATRFLTGGELYALGAYVPPYVGDDIYLDAILTGVQRASLAGAKVVVLSTGIKPSTPQIDKTIAAAFYRDALMTYLSYVLFVVSGPDFSVNLVSPTLDPPSGLQLDNVITVGGTAHCAPGSLWTGGGYGPLVDVYAPAQNVLTYGPPGDLRRQDGNSYSAPQVASLAAILLSIKPDLTPSGLKSYIVNHSVATKFGAPRLALGNAIMQAIIDTGTNQTVLNKIDDDADHKYDGDPKAVNRICGGVQVSVDEAGSYSFVTEEERVCEITPGTFVIQAVDSPDSFALNCINCVFELEKAYSVVEDAGLLPDAIEGSFTNFAIGATTTSGSLTVEKCRIDGRWGLDNLPILVNIKGSAEGGMSGIEYPSARLFDTPFRSSFDVECDTFSLLSTPSVITYLEQACEGGLQH